MAIVWGAIDLSLISLLSLLIVGTPALCFVTLCLKALIVLEPGQVWCSKELFIFSRDFPLVSGIANQHTILVNKLVDPKRKYTPNDECARKIGVVKATIQFAPQLALCARLDALARVSGGWISLEYILKPIAQVVEKTTAKR